MGWIENKPRGCLCSFLPIVLAHLIPDLGWGSRGEWSTGSVLSVPSATGVSHRVPAVTPAPPGTISPQAAPGVDSGTPQRNLTQTSSLASYKQVAREAGRSPPT